MCKNTFLYILNNGFSASITYNSSAIETQIFFLIGFFSQFTRATKALIQMCSQANIGAVYLFIKEAMPVNVQGHFIIQDFSIMGKIN